MSFSELERLRTRPSDNGAEDRLRVALLVLGASSLGGLLNFFHAPWWVAVPALTIALAAIVLVSVPTLRKR